MGYHSHLILLLTNACLTQSKAKSAACSSSRSINTLLRPPISPPVTTESRRIGPISHYCTEYYLTRPLCAQSAGTGIPALLLKCTVRRYQFTEISSLSPVFFPPLLLTKCRVTGASTFNWCGQFSCTNPAMCESRLGSTIGSRLFIRRCVCAIDYAQLRGGFRRLIMADKGR
ncbi:hypothetical protein V8C26DRAFT_414403 [Trichoderma gracile]